MIHSMTGFGEARAREDGVTYRVEIRSVNNRYFKLLMRLPEQFQRYEIAVDKQLRSRLGRGSVTYNLRVVDENPAAAYEINEAALSHYVARLREVALENETTRIDLATLMEIPGVCQPPDIDEAVLDAQFQVVHALSSEATDKLIAMRKTEGEALLRDLLAQCAVIRDELAKVEARAPAVVAEFAAKLHSRVQQLLAGSSIELEHDALVREVAIFAERCDVNEEIARTRSHVDQFEATCAEGSETGRKLEFLSQEMLREANTMGSKANDSEMARRIIEIKSAIDRLKEQTQNVA